MSDRTIVVVARHGERQDYVMLSRGENWVKTAARPWDPPLSELGWKQGEALGMFVRQCIGDLGLPPLKQIYTSPFQRCRETAVAANSAFDTEDAAVVPPVKVEYGLVESLNEAWYRSWALPTSNGTWDYHECDESGEKRKVNLDTLHRAALHPASSIVTPAVPVQGIDTRHRSSSRIEKVYCWGSFESHYDQRKRMRGMVNSLAKPGSTVMFVSHGGPVTHLFAELTKQDWWIHGEASYASCTIYEKTADGRWVTLVMNESKHVPEC